MVVNQMAVRHIVSVIVALLLGGGIAEYGLKLPNKRDEKRAHKLHAEFCERLLRSDRSGAFVLIPDSVGGKEDVFRYVNGSRKILACKERGLPETWDSPGPSDGMRQWVSIEFDEREQPGVRRETEIVFAYSRSLLSDWKELAFIEGSTHRIRENDDGTTTILESMPLNQIWAAKLGGRILSLSQAIREDCLPASRYPEGIRAVVNMPANYSGLWALGGTSREYCSIEPGCKIYSKSDFETLWGEKVLNFTNDALFALMPCRLDSDYPQLLAEAEARAWSTSALPQDSDTQKLIGKISGKWCGRNNTNPGFAPAELTIAFQERRGRWAGYTTQAWARVPEGPIGEEDYYDQMLLVPQTYDPVKGVLVLHEVSHARSGSSWILALGEMALKDYQGREYRLAHACDGYWTKPGKFPF